MLKSRLETLPKVRSTTHQHWFFTRWSLAGTESQLCLCGGNTGSWFNYKNPSPAPRGLPTASVIHLGICLGPGKGWCLSPQLEEVFRYADSKGTETGISPPTWEQGPVQSCSHPQPAGLGSHSLHVLWPADMLFSWCYLGWGIFWLHHLPVTIHSDALRSAQA